MTGVDSDIFMRLLYRPVDEKESTTRQENGQPECTRQFGLHRPLFPPVGGNLKPSGGHSRSEPIPGAGSLADRCWMRVWPGHTQRVGLPSNGISIPPSSFIIVPKWRCSLVSEGNYGIDTHRAPCWDVASQCGDSDQSERCEEHRLNICGLYTKK